MKGTVIRKSRNKAIIYLTLSVGLLGFIVYQYIMDQRIYPTGKSFYWVGIVLFASLTVFNIYDLIDKRPIYVLNEKGITRRGSHNLISWKQLYYFEIEVITRKYINIKQATLFDLNGKKVITLDLTHSDMTIERFERILKRKLKQKPKVVRGK
jgi:hypothetical protein